MILLSTDVYSNKLNMKIVKVKEKRWQEYFSNSRVGVWEWYVFVWHSECEGYENASYGV